MKTAIIGGVVGGVGLLLLILAFILGYRVFKKRIGTETGNQGSLTWIFISKNWEIKFYLS